MFRLLGRNPNLTTGSKMNRRSIAIMLIGIIATIAGFWTAASFGVISGLVVGVFLGFMLFRMFLFASRRMGDRT
jgi:uncharacterized membrane-anchored protein